MKNRMLKIPAKWPGGIERAPLKLEAVGSQRRLEKQYLRPVQPFAQHEWIGTRESFKRDVVIFLKFITCSIANSGLTATHNQCLVFI